MCNRDCLKCGAKCCIAWGGNCLSVTIADITKWVDSSCEVMLKYIHSVPLNHKYAESDIYVQYKNRAYYTDVWFDPETGNEMQRCPFLSDDLTEGCSIYPKDGETDIRPAICGDYPWDKKCINDTLIAQTDPNQLNMAMFPARRRSVRCEHCNKRCSVSSKGVIRPHDVHKGKLCKGSNIHI